MSAKINLPKMIVVSPDDGTDAFKTFIDAVNFELRDRGLLPPLGNPENLPLNLDGIEQSFDCCIMDAAAKLRAEVEYVGRDTVLVAIGGAPLVLARNQMDDAEPIMAVS